MLIIFLPGFRLVLRGQKTDKAVLCTKNKTFDIKEAETSNSLLLIPNLKFAEDVPIESGDRDIEEKEVCFSDICLLIN